VLLLSDYRIYGVLKFEPVVGSFALSGVFYMLKPLGVYSKASWAAEVSGVFS